MSGAGDEPGLVGVLETTEPWTIKAFSRALRLAAINAAKIEGLTAGQWLERCVRDRLESGSYPTAQGKGVNLGELALAYQQAQALAAAAGVPVPASVAKSALALTRRAARQVEGVQPGRRILPRPSVGKIDGQ